MAKSGQNEIVDFRKGCCKEADHFTCCIILNTTNELLSKLNHNSVLKIHTFFNDIGDLMRSTERKTQSKQAELVTQTAKNIEMLRELREKLSTRNSSSQTEDEVINVDTRASDKMKKETVNAITFATHPVTVLNQIHRENLSHVVKDFGHLRILLRIYAENAKPDNGECGCALRNIGTETRSNIVNGESSSETSLDAPTKARGKKRHADFIPEEIAKVSDTLTAEARLACDVMIEETMLYARKSVMLITDRTAEETSGDKESLISPVIDGEENTAAATDVATDAMQRESFPIRSTEISQDSSAFSDKTSQMSRLNESLDAKVSPLLFTEEMKTDGDVMSVKHVEKDDSPDTAAITAVVTGGKEGERRKEESSSEVSLRLAIDKDFFVVDKTALDDTVCSTITDTAEESTIQEPIYLTTDPLEESIRTRYKIPLFEKIRAIEETEVKHSPAGEPTPPVQDMFPESVQIKHKMPRHRKTWAAKKTDEVETSPVGRPTQPAKDMFQESVQSTHGMPRFKKTRTIKDTMVETSSAGEEPTQLTKDTSQDSTQTRYKVSRFKKTRTIKDTENETSPAGEPTLANDVLRKPAQLVQTTQKTVHSKRNQTTKSRIESCSTNTFTSFTCPKTTKRSRDYLGRSTTGISQDCRQLKILQPRCCGRSRYHDTSRLSLQNRTTRNAALDHVCYSFPQDPCISRCRSGYWWWGKTCDINSHRKYGATIGHSLHAYCNGDTGYYCPHLNTIDNCRAGHCHWNDGRSVWNDDRHYGRS